MSFDFSTLVTDRTQADVNRVKQIAVKIKNGTASESELEEFNSAAMKGSYNHTDLNRVTEAMEALKAKLEGYGYAVPGYQRIKVPHVLPEQEPTSRLPDGYTELTYIESTGTQYINTVFKMNQDSRVVMKAQPTSEPSPYGWLFDGRDSGGKASKGVIFFNGDWCMDYNVAQSSTRYHFTTVSPLDVLNVDYNKNQCTINGETGTFTPETFQSSANLVLLALNTAGTVNYFVNAKLYNCQVFDNGELIRDFVPCINPSRDVGLFDVVNQQFYGNAGSGTFAAGEEVVDSAMAYVVDVSDGVAEYDPYTWYEFDWPTPETMTVYLLNVSALRSVFAVMKSTPSVPKDAFALMVQEANNIEKILVDINDLFVKSTQVWFYSGELFAGEV